MNVTSTAALRPFGLFAHLEHDHSTGRPELQLLLGTDGTWTGLVPIPVYLDRPTLGTAVADVGAVNDATATGAMDANLRGRQPDPADEVRGLHVPALVRALNQLTLENRQLRHALAQPNPTVVPFPGRPPRHQNI